MRAPDARRRRRRGCRRPSPLTASATSSSVLGAVDVGEGGAVDRPRRGASPATTSVVNSASTMSIESTSRSMTVWPAALAAATTSRPSIP